MYIHGCLLYRNGVLARKIQVGDIGNGFGIVNAAAIPVIRTTEESSEALVGTEALSDWYRVVSTSRRPFAMGVYPPIPLTLIVGRSPAVLVTKFMEPADSVAIHVSLQSFVDFDRSTISAGMASNLIWRTPDSPEKER